MNDYPKKITDIHIELTDKCQASCPMCARNYNGGAERPFVGQKEITLEQVKAWFSPDFLKNIKNFYACGNYGDPIIAKDCLEIFEYIRYNTDARLSIHTNGSARSTKWWENLAKAMSGVHDVVFGIDGFAKSHVMYRRGTDWQKIIDNATAFINAGGNASVDCLIFKHNQHEVEQFEVEMKKVGFTHVNFKSTARFYDMESFPVEDKLGNVEYTLEPTDSVPFKRVTFLKLEEIKNNITLWTDEVEKSIISPECVSHNEVYIDARGNVFPCCWVGSDVIEEPLPIKLPVHQLRNSMVENTKEHFGNFVQLNLNNISIDKILESMQWKIFDDINQNKPWICTKNCKT